MLMVCIQVDMFLIQVNQIFRRKAFNQIFHVYLGQLYFDDLLTDRVALLTPYISHNITRVLNNVDGIFKGQGGNSSVLSVKYINEALGFSGGMIATINLGINSSAIPAPVQGGGGPPPPSPTTAPSEPITTPKSGGITNTIANVALILFHTIVFFLY